MSKSNDAMRANTGKPELAYVLSFKGAVELMFAGSRFERGLGMLSAWYRGETDDLRPAALEIVRNLRIDWPELQARTSEKGAIKYARGNYLKGRGWHDTCNSLLRHLDRIERHGEELDPELGISHDGPIAWNVSFLLHCVLTMPERDDRLRAPADEAPKISIATTAPSSLNA